MSEPIENLDEELPEQEENLVAELVGEFSERSHRGEVLSFQEFLDRCPNERCRDEFTFLANMSQIVDLNAAVNDN